MVKIVPSLKRATQYAMNDAAEQDVDLDGDTWTSTHVGMVTSGLVMVRMNDNGRCNYGYE